MTEPRNPTLEAAIADDPDDRQAHLVYADWLEERGHPRAALIRAHVAEADPAQPGKQRPAKELFAKHANVLLGPLARFDRALVWKFGFVRSAQLYERDGASAERARTLLQHPSARLLLELTIGTSEASAVIEEIVASRPFALRTLTLHQQGGADPPLDLHALCSALPGLRSLCIWDCSLAQQDLSGVLPRSLERLLVRQNADAEVALRECPSTLTQISLHGRFVLERIALPNLTSLSLVGPEVPELDLPMLDELVVRLHTAAEAASIARTPLAKLTKLGLHGLELRSSALSPLFARGDLPALVELELIDSTLDEKSCDLLRDAPFADQLQKLSFWRCKLPAGTGDGLTNPSAFPNLKELILRDSTLDDDDTPAMIREARPELVVDGESDENRYERDDE